MLSRNMANAVPHATSPAGSQPATSLYHATAWTRVGRPGNKELVAAREVRGLEENEEGANAACELRREVLKEEMVQGTIRLERSERGCPIVDISQLRFHRVR